VPWGISLGDNPQAIKLAESSRADFAVFDPSASLEMLAIEDLGKVMTVAGALDSALRHGAGELPIDAIYYLRQPQNDVTWLELMQFRRLADLIAKPLLVPVSPDITPAQLNEMWKAGVDGVVVAVTADAIPEMRRRIDGLSLPARRKWLKARPLVPVISAEAPNREAEPDEDDGE